jgi:hypothetical protein
MKTHRILTQSALTLAILGAPCLVGCAASPITATEQVKSAVVETAAPQQSAFTNEACITVSQRGDVQAERLDAESLRIRFDMPEKLRYAHITEATMILHDMSGAIVRTDVTELARGWTAGSAANDGVTVKGEYATPDTAMTCSRPVLVVCAAL